MIPSSTFHCCLDPVGIKLLFKIRKLKMLSVIIDINTLSFHILHRGRPFTVVTALVPILFKLFVFSLKLKTSAENWHFNWLFAWTDTHSVLTFLSMWVLVNIDRVVIFMMILSANSFTNSFIAIKSAKSFYWLQVDYLILLEHTMTNILHTSQIHVFNII